MALGVADGESVVAAARDEVTAARRLFAAAEAAVTDENETDIALTAYGLNGRPLRWTDGPRSFPPIGAGRLGLGSSPGVRSACGSSTSPR